MLPINMNQYANDFTSTVRSYYDDLKKYKPLTKAKERRLLKKCKKGSIKAKNEILEANLKFVFNIAKHYTGRGVSISELISDGNIGLLKAVDKFDETKDVKFISYAVWWVRQSMLESIKKKNAINFVEIEPETSNDSSMDNSLIDNEYDDAFFTNEYTNEEEIHCKEIKEHQKDVILKLLNNLDDRERDIIESYYGIGDKEELNLSEISKKYKLSIERIRQIKKQGLKKMKSGILLFDDLEDLFV